MSLLSRSLWWTCQTLQRLLTNRRRAAKMGKTDFQNVFMANNRYDLKINISARRLYTLMTMLNDKNAYSIFLIACSSLSRNLTQRSQTSSFLYFSFIRQALSIIRVSGIKQIIQLFINNRRVSDTSRRTHG